jgi:hypothetical protein
MAMGVYKSGADNAAKVFNRLIICFPVGSLIGNGIYRTGIVNSNNPIFNWSCANRKNIIGFKTFHLTINISATALF